eukprot:12984074-Alexandrium_andersonii.AAC.1
MTGLGCPWQSHGMQRALGAPCRLTGCAVGLWLRPTLLPCDVAPGWGARVGSPPLCAAHGRRSA